MKGGLRGCILLTALALVGSAAAYLIPAGVSAVTGTTTQTATLDVGTGDFTYDGQTVPVSSWPNMGNLAYVKWIRTPLGFACEPGTLAVTDKTTYAQEQKTLTFAPPGGSVIVGVLVKSGSMFDFVSAAWAEDGSAATVTVTQGYSGTAVFYCKLAAGTTTVLTTTVGTTTIVTTITLPRTATTLSGTTVTLPGTTTTLPGATTTLPGTTTTLAGTTTTVKSAPLTPKKVTKAKGKRKSKHKKPKVVSHKRPKVTG
jgi:hypothetical protein